MEIFMEQDVVAKVRILRQLLMITEHRTFPIAVLQEELAQASRQFVRYLRDGHEFAGASGTFDFKLITIVMVEFLK
jgi:hypothetical protein